MATGAAAICIALLSIITAATPAAGLERPRAASNPVFDLEEEGEFRIADMKYEDFTQPGIRTQLDHFLCYATCLQYMLSRNGKQLAINELIAFSHMHNEYGALQKLIKGEPSDAIEILENKRKQPLDVLTIVQKVTSRLTLTVGTEFFKDESHGVHYAKNIQAELTPTKLLPKLKAFQNGGGAVVVTYQYTNGDTVLQQSGTGHANVFKALRVHGSEMPNDNAITGGVRGGSGIGAKKEKLEAEMALNGRGEHSGVYMEMWDPVICGTRVPVPGYENDGDITYTCCPSNDAEKYKKATTLLKNAKGQYELYSTSTDGTKLNKYATIYGLAFLSGTVLNGLSEAVTEFSEGIGQATLDAADLTVSWGKMYTKDMVIVSPQKPISFVEKACHGECIEEGACEAAGLEEDVQPFEKMLRQLQEDIAPILSG